jgi:transposase
MPHKNPMISPTKKGEIYGKYKQGMSMSALADEYERAKSTIQGIIEKRERTGTVKPSWNTGNPHIMSLEDEERLIRQVRKNPKQTSAQLSNIVKVSASTVERILHRHGYIRAICRRKPILKDLNIKQRLEWAAANVNQDWTRVIFTDEAAFEVGDDFAQELCWRLPHEQNMEANLSVRKKRGAMVHVWGAIIHGHKFPLVRFALQPAHQKDKVRIAAQTINADVYLEQIMKGPLKNAVVWAEHQGLEPLVLEDGAGPHRIQGFKAVRAELGINNLKHPASSPDLNAIENCWAYVKDRIRRMPGHPSSQDALWKAIEKHWNEIPQDIIDKWIDEFEERRLAVVAAKGKHTRW